MDAQAAAELLAGKFAAYHRGDWEHWVACYDPGAQVFYNTASDPMTPQGAAEMHAASVASLSAYSFEESDDHYRAWLDDDGVLEATFYGLWWATFRETGTTISIPTHVRYWFEDGLIVEEHGFWDTTPYLEAARAATADPR